MTIKKQFTQKQSEIKSGIFELVRNKISEYRKTSEYTELLKSQISKICNDYKDFDFISEVKPMTSPTNFSELT